MRRPVSVALVVGAVALLGVSAFLFMRYQQTKTQLGEAQASADAASTRYSNTLDAIAEIQDSLNAIAIGDENVALVQGGLQSEKNINGPNGHDALDRIATLRSSIERNKNRIRQLESSLKASGIETKGLKRMVANLKTSVADKEARIAVLVQDNEALKTQVTGLETTVQENQVQIAQKDEALEDRRRELATVYYVVGDKRELTEKGVVVAKGGVLGMGKTLEATGQLTADLVRPIDTDQQTTVTIAAQKAQVVSDQPAGSYELIESNGQVELRILNPVEFRKVRQLVIVTA